MLSPLPRSPSLRLTGLLVVVQTTRLRDVVAQSIILSGYHDLVHSVDAVQVTLVAMRAVSRDIMVMMRDQITALHQASVMSDDILTSAYGLSTT